MFSKLKSYWEYGSTFCGMEVTMLKGKEKVFAVTAKKKHGEFTDLEFLQFSSVMEVGKHLSKQQHCFLTINSDRVLIKYTTAEDSDLKTVSNAFPGLSHNDFYTEILKTPYGSIVAVCRKDYIHNLLKVLEQQKIHVLGFHLGIIPLQVLTPLISVEHIRIPGYSIQIKEKHIRDFSPNENYNPTTYDMEGIKVDSEFMISLALLFNYTAAGLSSSNNFGDQNKTLFKHHQEKVFFQKGSLLAVGFLLIALLVNTFFFNSYFKREQQLNEELVLMETGQKGIESKRTALNKKELLAHHILNSGNSKSSYYLNQIVVLKPLSIGFSDLQYQPLNRSIRPDKPIDYSPNRVVILGESRNKADFSEWITKLGTLEWQENVNVVHYGNLGKDLATFTVTIIIKDESKN